MFSYREFSDGAHEYRKRVSQTLDRDYEEVRSDNELAVLRLAKVSDDQTLAHILTYLESLLFETERENPASFKDCMRLSIMFTYFKAIAQRCQLAMTKLDDIYADTAVDYALSTGGMLYTLQPGGIFTEELPRARAKIPISETTGRVRTIIHEAFVALVALNPLRRLIPSFSYLYAFWECGHFVDPDDIRVNGLCTTQGTRPVLIYESNPNGISMLGRMRNPGKVPPTLTAILDYLLQLMGALEMAHSYADYTHYDLHTGNVLVQQLREPITILFQDYALTTKERIIIIDNGLAHCVYDPRDRKVELYKPREITPEAERLYSLKSEHYGSIQNALIGVRKDRSYPLGDVFRIFFDLYSLCTPEMQSQLQPLVQHFFSDGREMSRKLGGPSEHASSMLNAFALPPFREEMYRYRYADFAQVIIQKYGQLVTPFVEIRKTNKPLRPISLTEIIDPRVIKVDYIPKYYEIGLYGQLDPEGVGALIPRLQREDEQKVLYMLYKKQVQLEEFVYDMTWDDIPSSDSGLSLKLILDDKFFDAFVKNIWRCVNQVQWIRMIYSNATVIAWTITLLTSVEVAITTIAHTLGMTVEEIATLATYCKRARVPTRSKEAFRRLLQISESIAALRLEGPVSHHINWYRACMPGVLMYLRFCVQWGDATANFGALDLPAIGK